MTLFTATLIFQSFAEALEAGRAFREAGYVFEIRDDLDPYCHATTFAEVRISRAGLNEGRLWRQLDAIIGQLNGDIHEAGLVEDLAVERQMHRLQ
jgi:hypothetical protein